MSETRAVIIGGSIAGLLVARVCSDFFAEVIVLERDCFPPTAAARSGVPQARHGHLLMAKGQEVLAELLPELLDDLEAAGLPKIHWGKDTRLLMSGGWMAETATGIVTYACSRPYLEQAIRKQVLRIPNIQVIEEAKVQALLGDARGIHGLNYTVGQEEKSLQADLLIDASGRRSNSSEWLEALGYSAPSSSTINPFMGYATRWYQKPANFAENWKLLISRSQPENGLYRSGAIVEVENNQWMLILGGENKDYAPTDEAEFDAFLASLASPEIRQNLAQAKPISPIYGYRQTENHWRHYEKMSHYPENYLIVGDAVCGFNPIYAQGMTVAALEAQLLQKLLAGHETKGFAAKFQAELAKIVQAAWNLSASADAQLPEAEGSEANRLVAMVQHYINALSRLMPHDAELSSLFLRIMHMLESPLALLAPKILWRLAKFKLVRG